MHILITVLHVAVCIMLILVVLLQAGKGANMGAAFGGSSQTIFGSSGPSTFLSKMTTWVAIVFMLTSLALSHPVFNSGGKASLMKGATKPVDAKSVPVTPVAPAAPPSAEQKAPAVPAPGK